MVDCPLIFSGPMICALIKGRKTQTRRKCPRQPLPFTGPGDRVRAELALESRFQLGDRLWVKEAFRGAPGYDQTPPREWSRWPVHYEADGPPDHPDMTGRLRPSIHMPRWASRLTLHVEAIRVQRLQDISEADAEAEGVVYETADPPFYYVPGIEPHSITGVGVDEAGGRHAARSFGKLWDHIHGGGAWDANPWVVAVSFRVQRGNIDQGANA